MRLCCRAANTETSGPVCLLADFLLTKPSSQIITKIRSSIKETSAICTTYRTVFSFLLMNPMTVTKAEEMKMVGCCL